MKKLSAITGLAALAIALLLDASAQLSTSGSVVTGAAVGRTTTIVANDSGTNFVVNFLGSLYQYISATNNINVAHATNGPGVASIKIRPQGADRILTFPTNWVLLDTNNFTVAGVLWKTTVTNALNGNGPRVGILSVWQDGTSATNVAALFRLSP